MIVSVAFTKRVCAFAALAMSGLAPMAHADVVISNQPTKNMTCSAGVCAPTQAHANLNVSDLANMLASGDVKIVSDSAAKDIKVSAPLSWTSASRLTLDAYRSIRFEGAVLVAGNGALSITSNQGGSGGDFSFQKRGQITFWDSTSSLVINGASYVLASSIRQLASAIQQNSSGQYALATDYHAGKHGPYSQSPFAVAFDGTLEGLGHTIHGLQISSNTAVPNVGLFAQLGTGGVIRDLNLVGEKITTTDSQYVGGLAGTTSGGKIEQISVDAVISAVGSMEAGVLIGWSSSDTITDAATAGSVDGSNGVGGLIGEIADTSLTWSHSSAVVSSQFANGGGLVGISYTSGGSGSIDHCFATGTVTIHDGPEAGGLVGSSGIGISDSYATGAVTVGDSSKAGGLAGSSIQISNSYATGTVSAGSNAIVGGLTGVGGYGATSSYSTGAVTAGSGGSAGGFVGYDYPVQSLYRGAYWDTDSSGIADPSRGAGNVANDPGIKGLSTAVLQSGLPKGFSGRVWGQHPGINGGLPFLKTLPPSPPAPISSSPK